MIPRVTLGDDDDLEVDQFSISDLEYMIEFEESI
jgi:hypothetical protein